MTHTAAVTVPHFLMGVLFLLMAGIGIGEAQADSLEGRRRLILPTVVALGGLAMFSISMVDAWTWHEAALTHTAQLRAAVGRILCPAGLAQGWANSRDAVARGPTAPLSSVLFAGVLSAMREAALGDERLLHIAVAALVAISTLANLAAFLSGEPARAMRLFGHLALAGAAFGLLLFEPSAAQIP